MATRRIDHEAEDRACDLIGYDETLRIVRRARKAPGSTLHQIRVGIHFTPSSAQRHGVSLEGKFVGLQDQNGEIVEGTRVDGGDRLRWETLVVLVKDPAGPIRWLGSTVHGPKADRFLYLAWPEIHEGWDGMRVKIQFRYAEALIPKIVKAERPSLTADVTGRLPHDTTPVAWVVRDLLA